MRALQTRSVMVAVVYMNTVAAAVEGIMKRIWGVVDRVGVQGGGGLEMMMQMTRDVWAVEERVCECVLQLYPAADCVQVIAAVDQLDEQLQACASAFKMRLEDVCKGVCVCVCVCVCVYTCVCVCMYTCVCVYV